MNTNKISEISSPCHVHDQAEGFKQKNIEKQTTVQALICNCCQKQLLKAAYCSGCKKVYYCNQACQRTAWSTHRPDCLKSRAVESVKNSSLNTSPWKTVLKEFSEGSVSLKHWNAQVYFPKTPLPHQGFLHFTDCFATITSQLSTQAKKTITKRLTSNPELKGKDVILPSINFLKAFKQGVDTLKQEALKRNIHYSTDFFIKMENCLELYLSDKPGFSFPTETEEWLDNALKDLKIAMDQFVFAQAHTLGFNISKKNIEITDEHLKVFGLTRDEANIDLNNFSCASYALLMCGEKQAKNEIFTLPFSMEKLLDLLYNCHYEPISFPQEGDLVIYFDEINGPPKHVGRCRSTGSLISKVGVIVPYEFEHQVNDISILYGGKFIFFRKKPA